MIAGWPATVPSPDSQDSSILPSTSNVEDADAAWYGFALLRTAPIEIASDYWALARTEGGFRIELAGVAPLAQPATFAASLLGIGEDELLVYRDDAARRFRFAALGPAGVQGLLFLAPRTGRSCAGIVGRAFDRANCALELDEEAVSGCLDDPTSVTGYSRVDEIAPMRLVPRYRPNFIRGHQATVAEHVGSHYCRKATFHPWSQRSTENALLPRQSMRNCYWRPIDVAGLQLDS